MDSDKKKVENTEEQNTEEDKKIVNEEHRQVCGIVMPISEIDGLPKSHWDEVYNIIAESVSSAGFKPNLVSNSEDIGVIQKRIVQNLYENPIVVCDVSAKNPNVMFELGLRLAFDKPTIIIKDDKTNYSFDTSPIEHLEYPRDLRFSKIRDFGNKLARKIISTHEKASEDIEYSTFLKHFGTFKVAKIETEEVTKEDMIMEEIRSLKDVVIRTSRVSKGADSKIRLYDSFSLKNRDLSFSEDTVTLCFKGKSLKGIEELCIDLMQMKGVDSYTIKNISENHNHVLLTLDGSLPKNLLKKRIESKYQSLVNWID